MNWFHKTNNFDRVFAPAVVVAGFIGFWHYPDANLFVVLPILAVCTGISEGVHKLFFEKKETTQ